LESELDVHISVNDSHGKVNYAFITA